MIGKPFGQLAEGDTERWRHTVTAADIAAFSELSGDDKPLHMEPAFAQVHGFRDRVVHGMLLGAYLSRVVGTALPGPGVIWLSQNTRFVQAVYPGDEIEVVVTVVHKSEALRTVALDTTILNQRGEKVLTGDAKMMMLARPERVPWEETVAVVTGASRGIGAAVARALGERGARVVVNYNRSREAADEVVAAIDAAGGQAVAVQADVSDSAQTAQLADSALDRFGRVDVVVNNATPPIERKPLHEHSWDEVDRYWQTYVQSAFTLSQKLVPGMKDRRYGRFVHLLTTAMWGTPPPGTGGYVAAKSGLWGLARGMAVELAPFGITVNAVSPSAVMTDQWADEPDTRRRALAMRLPAQRLATPDEVADSVVFLSSSEAGYITGANVPVAGGEVM
jgi:3-oxoacyl-[acyl-carrier protein] reductase